MAKRKTGTTIKISGPGTADAMAALMAPRLIWRPMESAPNRISILVAYDSGDVRFVHATDNHYEWQPWDGKRERGVEKPTHWQAIPAHPLAAEMKRAREAATAAAELL